MNNGGEDWKTMARLHSQRSMLTIRYPLMTYFKRAKPQKTGDWTKLILNNIVILKSHIYFNFNHEYVFNLHHHLFIVKIEES